METKTTTAAIPEDVLADLTAICQQAAAGGPKDPELVRRILERSKKAREETLRTHGVQEIGVQIIRDMRDGAEV